MNNEKIKPANTSQEIRDWLSINGCFHKKGDKREITNVSLAGGSYSINDKLYEDFLRTMGNVILNNFNDGNLYFCEQRKEEFRYMIDFDFKDELILNDKQIIQFGKDIVHCLKLIYSDKDFNFDLIITKSTSSEIITPNLDKLFKSGIHFYLKDFKCSSRVAIIIRSILIQYLIHKYNERHDYNKWEDVIDISIYTKSGLRMLYNNKSKKCCKTGCPDCDHRKYIDINRKYSFLTVIDNDLNINDVMNILYQDDKNIYNLLVDTSIRFSLDNLTELQLPSVDLNSLPWFKSNLFLKERRKTNSKKKYNDIDELFDSTTLKSSKYDFIEINDNDDIRFKSFKKILKGAKKNGVFSFVQYKKCDIKRMFYTKCKKTDKIKSYLFQIDSTFCTNVMREHNSNHIYFILNRTNLIQKCHSQSKNTKTGISCKDCKTPLIQKIPNQIKKVFFQNEEKKKNINISLF